MDLGGEFHDDIAFWKWAIDQQLVRRGESLCAPIYDHIMRAPARRYYSDASFTAIGGFCPELKVYWRYSLAEALTLELKKQSGPKEAEEMTRRCEFGGATSASLGGRQHSEGVRAEVAGLVLRTSCTRKKPMVA